ncbi:MAG: DMT family transporter, partial [Simkania negevensis]|nr:DMT family transporter [Simkania negevensis]
MAIFFVILMYATWSSIFAMGKVALESSPPVFLTAFRMLLAGIVLLSYLFFKKKKELKIGKKEIIPLLFLSLLSIYLTNILEFWSLQHLSAAKVCFIYSLSPFFAVILSYIHFKEKISQKKILGMLIGFIGFIPVLLLQTGAEDLFRAFTFFSWPELAMMGAALFSIYGWVILRILVKKQTLSPLYANGYSMFFGGLMALVHSFFVDSWFQSSHLLPVAEGKLLPFFQGICWMTFISNILCYNLYGF